MKPFTKNELVAVLIIFLVLIGISAPNFVISLRRARDQTRRDDIGSIQGVLTDYFADFGEFPSASPDGKIMACKKPGDKVEIDERGRLKVDFIPCEWGKDGIFDLTPDSHKVYLSSLPRDPDDKKGVKYFYFSDGSRFQILASFEVKEQADYDPKIVARKIMCGTKICNVGKDFGCPSFKTLETCEKTVLH